MKCPDCNYDIKTIGEMTENIYAQKNDVPWYKLKKEEPMKCPKCGRHLKFNVSKSLYYIFFTYFAVGLFLIILVYLASMSWAWSLVIIYCVVGYPLWSSVIIKYGELVKYDT